MTEECDRKGLLGPDILRFYIATSRPQIDENLTVDSVNSVAEWVFTGSTRVTGNHTEAKARSNVYTLCNPGHSCFLMLARHQWDMWQ